jgi:hypothetical protein
VWRNSIDFASTVFVVRTLLSESGVAVLFARLEPEDVVLAGTGVEAGRDG